MCIHFWTPYIYHHQFVSPARISLTLSRHFSLSFIAFGRSSGLHPVSSHSCCMYIRAGRPAFAWPFAGVHRSTSLMSSSLLLQQCPATKTTWSSEDGFICRNIRQQSTFLFQNFIWTCTLLNETINLGYFKTFNFQFLQRS